MRVVQDGGVNLLLVDEIAEVFRFSAGDEVYEHLCKVLRVEKDRVVSVGVINGPRGLFLTEAASSSEVVLRLLEWEQGRETRPVTDLIVAWPRPAEAKRILTQAATMGVRRIFLVATERTDTGYAQSRMWSHSSVFRLLREGLAQGFHTSLPEVVQDRSLWELLPREATNRRFCLLDPYLGEKLLAGDDSDPDTPCTLIFGSERGYSSNEQARLRDNPFLRFRHLGPRILRTETAVVVSLSLVGRQNGTIRDARFSVLQTNNPPNPGKDRNGNS